jgi:hypothetical protein
LTVLNLLIPRLSDLRLNSTESCDKFQNQTFKDRCSTTLQGDKKLNLGADFKVRVSRRSFHRRDKIEFNLKSLKLEELPLFRAAPLVLRDEHFSYFDLAVNGNFEFFSTFFADCRIALTAGAGPARCGTEKLARRSEPARSFSKNFHVRSGAMGKCWFRAPT